MIMLIGKATKVSQFLISLDKSYEGEFLLGIETDSQDADGNVVSEKQLPIDLNENQIEEEMKTFLGDQYQTPPMFSAKKLMVCPYTRWQEKENC